LTKTETFLIIWLNIVTIVARSVRLLPAYMCETPTPLANCIFSDGLVSALPNMWQTSLRFINVVHRRLIDSLLDDSTGLRSGLFGGHRSGGINEKSYSVLCPVCKYARALSCWKVKNSPDASHIMDNNFKIDYRLVTRLHYLTEQETDIQASKLNALKLSVCVQKSMHVTFSFGFYSRFAKI